MANRVKTAVSLIVLTLVFAGVLWSSLREGTAYYKHVDEVMASSQQWIGKSLQLHGFVVPESIMVRSNTLEYEFQIQNKGSIVGASYIGIVPDTFKDNAEVVLNGRLTENGFQVSPGGILAKCPSKYEAKGGGK